MISKFLSFFDYSKFCDICDCPCKDCQDRNCVKYRKKNVKLMVLNVHVIVKNVKKVIAFYVKIQEEENLQIFFKKKM